MIKRIAAGLFTAVLLVLLSSSIALAQATSSISGTVVDSAGGAVPGVAVVVTSPGGQTFETVTNAEGIFNIPSIAPGAYKVAVSLAGFKTAVTDVRVAPGTPVTVKMTLEADKVTLSVTSPDNGTAAEELPADYAAQGFEIGFNANYLKDILSQIEGDTVELHLADAGAPTLIRQDEKSPALYVLMPMRV